MQGAAITELLLFLLVLASFIAYTSLYFLKHVFTQSVLKTLPDDIWFHALRTRKYWAEDVMSKAGDAKGEALLAVQQMRNVVVSATMLVMGISQVMSRLAIAMITDSNLNTINQLVSKDPITGCNYWAPPEIRLAVPLGATLLSLIFFGQTARMAIHVGFNVRVQGVKGSGADSSGQRVPLSVETICLLRRVEIFFTLGLRSMFLFVATIFWTLGVTALVVSSFVTLAILFTSDQLWLWPQDMQREKQRHDRDRMHHIRHVQHSGSSQSFRPVEVDGSAVMSGA